jgi:hypothetical protein
VGILFLRRESLTLDELRKQIESAGPTLLPQFTRLQYEEAIEKAEAPAKPILESLQNSPKMQTIIIKRNVAYSAELAKAVLKLTNFEKKYKNQIVDIPYTTRFFGQTMNLTRKGLEDPVLDAEFKKINDEIKKIKYEIDKPLTIDEGISIEGPDIEKIRQELWNRGFFQADMLNDEQVLEAAQEWGISTSSQLQQIKDSVADIREKLRKDDELRKKMEEESRRKDEERERLFQESMARKRKQRSKKESTSERLKRQRREETVARQKAQAEAEAKAKAEAKAQAEAKAKAEAKAQAEAEADAKAKAKEEAEERVRAKEVALAQEQERIEQQSEEIAKIQEIRKEAEAAIQQLREIPLEERIRRKIFVQPKMVHKPYPFVKSTPANPPYDTTKYEKRENLFKTSEISSIFPRPII